MKKFTLYWTTVDNGILLKDVGIIAFTMKKYYGYDVEIITWDKSKNLTDDKIYLENIYVEQLKDYDHLYKKLKEIDILMMIGSYEFNYWVIDAYKSVNPLGKLYLKLDMNFFWLNNLQDNIQYIVEQYKKCDLVSVESRNLKYLLSNIWNINLEYIPYGYYEFSNNKYLEFDRRKNIILFAGRIGTYQKNNQMLLNTFKDIYHKLDGWNIELAGSIEPDFLVYLENFFLENPHLKDRVKFLGKLKIEDLEKNMPKRKYFV